MELFMWKSYGNQKSFLHQIKNIENGCCFRCSLENVKKSPKKKLKNFMEESLIFQLSITMHNAHIRDSDV